MCVYQPPMSLNITNTAEAHTKNEQTEKAENQRTHKKGSGEHARHNRVCQHNRKRISVCVSTSDIVSTHMAKKSLAFVYSLFRFSVHTSSPL